MYLGNCTSNKNLHSIGAISSLQAKVRCLFFLPIICYCSVRDDNTKNYWQSEVSCTEGKCYASSLQCWFLWLNHPANKREWCYTDLGADSHHLPACPYFFLMETVDIYCYNRHGPACKCGIVKQALYSGTFCHGFHILTIISLTKFVEYVFWGGFCLFGFFFQ